MKHKPIIAGVLLVVVLLVAGGGVYLFKKRQDKAAEKPAMTPMFTVDVVPVEKVSWFETARLVGTVVAKRSVQVANEVSGTVREVMFDTGDEVQAEQVLLKLDTRTEEADLAAANAAMSVAQKGVELAQADLVVAQSNLELARSNQQRYSTASGAVSASEIDRVNADLRKANADIERAQSAISKSRAEVEQAAARVAQIQTVIDKKTITAPFHARASIRTVHPGQYLPEGTPIIMLAEITDDIYLDFAIPQEYASRAVPGLTVVAQSEVLGPDLKITVLSVDSQVNPNTRNIRVRSTIPDPEHKLKQGMFIDVVVPLEAPRDYLAIPTTAVRRAAFGDHVWAVVPAPAEKQMPGMPPLFMANTMMVELGPDIGGKVLVKKGLQGNEEIAAGGSFKLFPGATVIKAQAGPPGGGPGGPGAPEGAAPNAGTEKPVASSK
ncbi:MAG TPA: efflux RND transporter periplasmic adaptor subunit [Phycisphaerales bacterium]|nr:efflux RND transporter periplasmic adaptor subunit [Phycisphaerales bacterium]